MSNFIPSLHFKSASEKMSEAWCKEVIDYYYHNSYKENLLKGKKLEEIEGYSTGDFDMTPFKKIFKSLNRALKEKDPIMADRLDSTGLDWTPLALIPAKLNAAVSIVQKIPVEITCTALDPLAAEKKREDINFLKNKPTIEADLQEIANQMQLGKVELGSTQHADTSYSDSPYGLDLTDPEELSVFEDLIYNLNVESAFETALQSFWEQNNGNQIKLLEIIDQYKYGVSANRAYVSPITGLPEAEYLKPDSVEVPPSDLPDYSDNTYRILNKRVTAMEMFDFFEISLADRDELLNGAEGWCECNNRQKQDASTWGTLKVDLVYMEVKSVDWIGIAGNPKSKRGAVYFTTNEKEATKKIWAQNTYSFWWLKNTNKFFKISKLPFAHREIGKETYQSFSINIYRSQKKGAVELAIGENKKAQIADVKLQHAIIKSVPAGKFIDLKFLRNAVEGLKSGDSGYTVEALLQLGFESNNWIGDSEGFDGKQEAQYRPVQDLAGGLKSEVQGYLDIINTSDYKIGLITGANQQLTGQSANPEGLVGLQKLLMNASINSLHYVNEAITAQMTRKIRVWKSGIKTAIEAGGEPKKAIVALVGKKKAKLIDGIEESRSHDIGVRVSISQREEERARFEQALAENKQKGVISTADEYMLRGITNPKDAFALLAVKEKQFQKKADSIRQEQYRQQQELLQQQGVNMQNTEAVRTDGKIKQIYAKGDVEQQIAKLSSELGMTEKQVEGLIRSALQKQRMEGQVDKSLQTIQAKNNVDLQKPVNV